MRGSLVTVDGVIGDGSFIHVGLPTALATSPELVVVGGDLGWAQWNGRSLYDRSDRSVGWFPLGIYRADDLRCLRVLTSRWKINAVAIHPAGRLIAIGTGSYDGGYAFEGELLLHDLALGTTASVLTTRRTVEALEWRDAETLAAVVAPPTDEEVDWPHVGYEVFGLHRRDWASLGAGAVDLDAESSTPTEAVEPDSQSLQSALVELSEGRGPAWRARRQVWAVAATDDGVLVGLESAIERWDEGRNPVWRRAVNGTCTQLLQPTEQTVVAGVWQGSESAFLTRPTAVVALDLVSGAAQPRLEPGHPAVLVSRSDGCILLRDTQHGRAAGHLALVLAEAGERLGAIELSAYDLFNHYFDIRRAPEFLVLVGDDPQAHKDKQVAEARQTSTGRWTLRRLFPLTWRPGAQVFGGPGVFLDDAHGKGIVHGGAIHDGAGLLRGNAFVVRRRFPDGQLVWEVPLDNQVTAVDEREGRVVAATNLGELVVIDAASGTVLAHDDHLSIDGHPVVPLSLSLDASNRAWIGTLDGRVIQGTVNLP